MPRLDARALALGGLAQEVLLLGEAEGHDRCPPPRWAGTTSMSGLSGGLLLTVATTSDQPRRSRSRSSPGAAESAAGGCRGLGGGRRFVRCGGFGGGRFSGCGGLGGGGFGRRLGGRGVDRGLRGCGDRRVGRSRLRRDRRSLGHHGRRGGGARRGRGARLGRGDPAARGRVEQRELELQAEAARTHARVGSMAPSRWAAAISAASSPVAEVRPASSRSRMASTTWSRNTRRSRPRSSSSSSRAMPAAASPEARAVTNAVDGLRVGEAEQLADGLGLDATAGRRQQLVEDRLRVAHAAGREARDERDRLGIDLAPVRREDLLELAADLGDGQPPDVEPLEPRQDRRRELLRVRRREHERDELRRLLERLEERVPGVRVIWCASSRM